MTDRASYATLVDQVFGVGTATFDPSLENTNSVIGALASSSEFSRFKMNFEGRLRRLNTVVVTDITLRAEVLATVNRIVDVGWDGAYAELCALDYFLAASETGPEKAVLDHTVPATTTLASEMGMQNANLDLCFPEWGISMDTKLLSDKMGQILEGIFKEYRSAKGIKNLVIIPSYDLADDFGRYSEHRNALLDELIKGVDVIAQPGKFASKVIPGLSYTFAWDADVHFGESTYNPYDHAKNHHSLLFGHAKKFSRLEPSLITFVIFPWSGEKVFPFDDSKRAFLRMLGKHFFNDYIASDELAKNFNKKFKSEISAGDVSKHLSGLIYLEDTCVTGLDPMELNIHASFIWNENALHQLANHALEDTLRGRRAYNLGE